MRILYYDCLAGLSGDMHLGALLSLGVAPEYLRAELSRLGLDNEFELRVTPDARNGISGLRVDVVLPAADADAVGGDAGRASEAGGGNGPASGQAPAHHEGRMNRAHLPHRNLATIESVIAASSLSETVKATSLRIFRRLAEAEGRVHGIAPEKVHFHEVGGVDAIVDIVGAAICFHALGVDAAWASPVELGGGFVRCAHGVLPVPAPATVELLTGIPTTRGATPHEATTPTGAAIIATLAQRFTATPAMTVQRTGYGVGHRQTELPNLLRVHLAETEEWSAPQPLGMRSERARLLQCNIDDMTAEQLAVALDLLMDEGAMDVHFTPVVMKKGRPATCVSLLCAARDEERFARLLFRHTTTLGLKSMAVDKRTLERRFERVATPLGHVTVKHALLDGAVLRSKPELEDCRELARRHGLSLLDVHRQVGEVVNGGRHADGPHAGGGVAHEGVPARAPEHAHGGSPVNEPGRAAKHAQETGPDGQGGAS